MMKRLLLACACLLAVSCGSSSPAAPAPARIAQYGGAWNGTYTITGCTQTGGVALANICGSLGNAPPYGFLLTQSGSNVSGSFSLGSIQFTGVGGTVGSDGSLAVQGTTITGGVTIVVRWSLTMPSTVMGGTVSQTWTSDTLSGSATVVGSISTALHGAGLIRTQATPRTASEVAAAAAQ